MSEEKRTRTLVMGIGNILLKDEGAGVRIVERLAELNPDAPDIVWLDGGTLSFTLAPEVEASRNLIVVDVTQLKSPAGTVQVFEDGEVDRMLGSAGRSVHEIGIMDLMDMARLAERLPGRSSGARSPRRRWPRRFPWPSAPSRSSLNAGQGSPWRPIRPGSLRELRIDGVWAAR